MSLILWIKLQFVSNIIVVEKFIENELTRDIEIPQRSYVTCPYPMLLRRVF